MASKCFWAARGFLLPLRAADNVHREGVDRTFLPKQKEEKRGLVMANGVIKFTTAAIAVGAALYAGIGYWGVPYATKAAVDKFIAQKLQRPVTLERVTFNPWTLRYEIDGLKIPAADGSTLVSLKTLAIDASWHSLTAFAPILEALKIDGLVVNAKMDDGLKADLQAISSSGSKGSPASTAASEQETKASSNDLPRFALYNISITNSSLAYADPKTGISQTITDLTVKLPFVSTLESTSESLVTPELSMKLNGTPIEASGSTKPFGSSLESQLNLSIQALELAPLAQLLPQFSGQNGGLTIVDGKLSSDLTFIFRNPTGGEPAKMLLAGSAEVDALKASAGTGKNAQTLAQLKRARVLLKELNIVEQKAAVESISVDDLKLSLENSKKELNVLAAINASMGEQSSAAPTRASAAADAGVLSEGTPSAWQWTLGEAVLKNADISWRDSSVSPTASAAVKQLNASLQNLSSNGKPGTFSASASLLSGSVELSGKLGLAPLTMQVSAKGDKLSAKSLEGYIQAASGLTVDASAAFSVQADISDAAQMVSGSAALRGLSVKRGKSTWASASSAEAKVNRIDLLTQSADIDRIAVSGAVVNVINTQSGVNFAQLGGSAGASTAEKSAGKKDAAGQSAGRPWTWRLGTAALSNSTVNIRDETLKPAASTQIGRLNVTVKNLSSNPGSEAAADVSAGAAGGSINAAGKFSLSPAKADMEIEAQKLQLKTLSPFLKGYAGLGAKNGQIELRGRATAAQGKNGAVQGVWKGDLSLADLDLTNAKGRSLMSWEKALLTGMEVQAPAPFSFKIAKAQIDEPAQKQTQAVKKAAGIASFISALAGKTDRAEKIVETADKLGGSIVITDIRYENGRFSASGLDAIGQAILDKISGAVSEKFPAAASNQK